MRTSVWSKRLTRVHRAMERRSAPGTSPPHNSPAKLAHVRELLGVTESEAKRVLDECGGNIEQVMELLYSEGRGYVAQETAGREDAQGPRTAGDGATATGEIDQSTGTVNNPIDLTKEDDALQKALALSLQEMNQQPDSGGISLEDQELSRALEASIAENQANLARQGLPVGSVFVDPLNPFERRRKGLTPVGLKNIGNTCWFSAVIQSLFHIPVFREVILEYQPPSLPNGMSEFPQCVRFVLELQKLFALLLRSERRYIDPQLAIQSLQEAFTAKESAGAQQDVSEFTHKLLEWIEDALTLSIGKEQVNPMLRLFNGRCRTEGTIGEESFVNESEFGAFPMQVQGHTHLHDSLDAATSNPEMKQETWFTHLPPILVLELSRFKFNQQNNQAEKIHDHFTFDRELFMDRYLLKNKLETRQRRLEVRRLKSKLAELEKRQTSYTHYNRKPVSIVEVLGLALKFVSDQENSEGGEGGEAREKRPRHSLHPLPRFVSSQEREILGACLGRWMGELQQDMAELQESTAAIRSSLEAVYSDRMMNTTCYHLHTVLVHQGQASRGHYWAYIRKNPRIDYQEGELSCDLEPIDIRVERNKAVQNGGRGTEPCDTAGGRGTEPCDAAGGRGTEPCDAAGGCGTEPCDAGGRGTEPCDAAGGRGTEPCDAGGHGTGPCDAVGGRGIVSQGLSCNRPSVPILTECQVTELLVTDKTPLTSLESSQASLDTDSQGSLSSSDDSPPPPAVLIVREPSECGAPDEGGAGRSEGMEVGEGEEVWLKFNDVSVSEVKWEEVERESYGGKQNTSAYCLVYISDALWKQLESVTPPPLSATLQLFVDADNAHFRTEMVEYKRKQTVTRAKQISLEGGAGVLAPASSEETLVESAAVTSATQPNTGLKNVCSPERMQVDSPPPLPVQPHLIMELTTRLKQQYHEIYLRTDTFIDPRPLDIASYAIHSVPGTTESLIKACLLPVVEQEAGRDDLVFLAKKELLLLLHQPGLQNNLESLRMLYKQFCVTCYLCVQAARCIAEEKWEMALSYAMNACSTNNDIIRRSNQHLALDETTLAELRRRAVQGTSGMALGLFRSGEVGKALDVAESQLIAGMKDLTDRPSAGDEEVVAVVREEWCQCLVYPGLDKDNQGRLADLLTKMLDDPSKVPSLPAPDTPTTVDHHTLAVELSNVIRLYGQK